MSVAATMMAAEQQIAAEHQLHEKVINEEFKIWKKTVPLLYNSIHTHALKWPLLTVDFSLKYIISEDKSTLEVYFITGSNTSLREQDSVTLRSINLPSAMAPDLASLSDFENVSSFNKDSSSDDLKVKRLWIHAGEVNRAKFAPSGERFVTFDNAGVVHLYDVNQDTPVDFKFHKTEGYCLEWVSETQFLSGANDSQVALWNVGSPGAPEKQYNTHTAVINDISHSKPTKVLFGTVADDYTTQIHDLRDAADSPAIKICEKHLQNAIQFHPEVSHLFATGGKDNVVNLYDARSVKRPIRQLFGHNDLIFGLRWDSFDPLQLYSWGLDKRVISWDLNYITEEYAPPVADPVETKKKSKHTEDPCLHFIHAGHTNRINDLAVHPSIPHLFATVGDDALLEIYQPKKLREDEDQDEDENTGDHDAEEIEIDIQDAENASHSKEEEEISDATEENANENHDGLPKNNVSEEKKNDEATRSLYGLFGINSKPVAEGENVNSDLDMAD